MKLVYLTSRFPFPLDRGDKLRAYYQIRELARHHEVHLISISESEISAEDKAQLAPYCESIDIHQIGKNAGLWQAAKGILSGLPLQVNYFYNKEVSRYIDLMINEIDPDHIICQMVRMAPYVLHHDRPKSIDYMDCLSANWSEVGAREVQRLPFARSLEQRRLQKYEGQVFDKFDHAYVISDRDKSALPVADRSGISVAPNGVNVDFFTPLPDIDRVYDIGFCGNLGYAHNAKAAHYLVDRVVPLMEESMRVLIAGARPPSWLNIKQSNVVTVAGWGDDVREHYQRAKVFLAPIFTGSGMQNKILEAMAQGIPCITTPFVNEAIGGEHETHLYIADTPRSMLSYAQRLLADDALYRSMSIASREYVKQKYSWPKGVEPILQAIDNI